MFTGPWRSLIVKTIPKIKQKSIEDYRNDIFILNVLRHKTQMLEGQIMEYENFKKTIEQLKKQLLNELKQRKHNNV